MSLELLLGTELDVDVLAGWETYGMSAPGRFVTAVHHRGVTHVELPSLTRSWDLPRDLRAVGEIATALRRLRPDVLHTHNPKTGVLGRIIGRLVGVPVVVNTCHGLWAGPADPWLKRFAVYGAEVLAAAFSHAELFQNAADLETLGGWIDRRRASVVGNGTDLVRFVHSATSRERVRRDLGLAEDAILVGAVGRLVAEKGIREFILAAERLHRTHGDRVAFVWVGPDDPGKRDAWVGEDRIVHFLGERSDMPAIYSALDIFVLPSYREGFSRSAMEAASCRTAMVLSDIRGCREIGTHEEEVLLVPPRAVAPLVDAIGRLVDSPDLRRSLATAAELRARSEFDQRRIAVRSLETYAEVAARRGLDWRVH
jgi:glycosyltransferase involved in cell wall biosynthesis